METGISEKVHSARHILLVAGAQLQENTSSTTPHTASRMHKRAVRLARRRSFKVPLEVACASPTVRRMFSSPAFSEQQDGVVHFPEIEWDTLKGVVCFLWTDYVRRGGCTFQDIPFQIMLKLEGRSQYKPSPENSLLLLMAADYFELPGLIDACSSVLARNIRLIESLELVPEALIENILRRLTPLGLTIAERIKGIKPQCAQLVDECWKALSKVYSASPCLANNMDVRAHVIRAHYESVANNAISSNSAALDECVAELSGEMRIFTLKNSQLSGRQLHAILSALHSAESIDLSRNNLVPGKGRLIAKSIHLGNITTLDVSNCAMTSESARSIAALISMSRKCNVVASQSDPKSNESAAKGRIFNQSAVRIQSACSVATGNGACSLMIGPPSYPSVPTMPSGTPQGPESPRKRRTLTPPSKKTSQLRCFNLRGNPLGDVGTASIFNTIVAQSCFALYDVNISGNNMGETGGLRIASALQRPRIPLKRLSMSSCNLGKAGLVAILCAAARNESASPSFLPRYFKKSHAKLSGESGHPQ